MKKMEKYRMTEQMCLRLNPEFKKAIEYAANKKGLKPQAWVRNAIADTLAKEGDYPETFIDDGAVWNPQSDEE